MKIRVECTSFYHPSNTLPTPPNISTLTLSLSPSQGAKSPASCMDLDAEQPMILHLIPRPSAAPTAARSVTEEKVKEEAARITAHTQKGS